MSFSERINLKLIFSNDIKYLYELLKERDSSITITQMKLPTFNEHKIFVENKVQDLVEKYESLPKDIEWHMIGHLQRNKVKYIASFVSLIHGVDSEKLIQEIDLRENIILFDS